MRGLGISHTTARGAAEAPITSQAIDVGVTGLFSFEGHLNGALWRIDEVRTCEYIRKAIGMSSFREKSHSHSVLCWPTRFSVIEKQDVQRVTMCDPLEEDPKPCSRAGVRDTDAAGRRIKTLRHIATTLCFPRLASKPPSATYRRLVHIARFHADISVNAVSNQCMSLRMRRCATRSGDRAPHRR